MVKLWIKYEGKECQFLGFALKYIIIKKTELHQTKYLHEITFENVKLACNLANDLQKWIPEYIGVTPVPFDEEVAFTFIPLSVTYGFKENTPMDKKLFIDSISFDYIDRDYDFEEPDC